MKNLVRPFLMRLLIFVVYTLTPEFKRPVFIVGAPRSGSTYLYEIVRRMQEPISFDTENTPLWLRTFPPESLRNKSEYISPEDCSNQKVILFKGLLFLKLIFDRKVFRPSVLFRNLFLRQPVYSYTEKTIANCFHLEAIPKMFPDALYIHLVRDGRANVSSMIEGWKKWVNVNAKLPSSADVNIKHWSYPMAPGWQDQLNQALEEICAWSWIEHNRCVIEKFNADETLTYIRVSYEDLVQDPEEELKKISEFTSLTITDECLSYVKSSPQSWSTISPPKQHKWKEKNLEKIERILPIIQPMMNRLGY